MRRRLAISALLGALLATPGCATKWFWEASIELPGPVTATCIEGYLHTQEDVIDIVGTGHDGVSFLLRLPGQDAKDAAALSITQSRQWSKDVMRLSTGYETGYFVAQAPKIALRARARELAEAITLVCTGKRIELGEEAPCGKGEPHDLCVRSR